LAVSLLFGQIFVLVSGSLVSSTSVN